MAIALRANDWSMKARSLTRQTATIVLTAQMLCALALSGLAVLHEGHTRLRAFALQRIENFFDGIAHRAARSALG